MTSPGPLGSARPARLIGFALLGVAVVAAGIGVFALTGNGSGQSAQGRPPTPPSSQSQPAPTTTAHPPPPTTATRPPTTTAYPSGQTTTVAPPPPTTAGQVAVAQVPVRVYNNSTVKGLAATAADDFRAAGFTVVEVGNYPQGVIDKSTAYFSPAPGEQETATVLGQDFGMRVQPRFPGIAFASPGVIVIITNDFQGAKK